MIAWPLRAVANTPRTNTSTAPIKYQGPFSGCLTPEKPPWYAQSDISPRKRLVNRTRPAIKTTPSVRSVVAAHRSMLDLPPTQVMSGTGVSQPAGYVARIVQEHEQASPLNSSESEEDPRIGLDEIAKHPK